MAKRSNLSAFGFVKESGPSAPSPKRSPIPSSQADPSKHKHRTQFSDVWLRKYAWIERRCDEDGTDLGMLCTLCLKHRQSSKTGVWTRAGCKTYREEAVKSHLKSTFHQVAVKVEADLVTSHSSSRIEVITLEQPTFFATLRAMYWLIKSEIPHTTNFESLLLLMQDVGCRYLESLNINNWTNYTSERSMQEMVLCIGNMLKNEKLAEIRASPYFALLCDETTDITVVGQLIIYAKYLDCTERTTRVTFLQIDEIVSCTSNVITEKIIETLTTLELDFRSKLAGFGSDGAADMVGKRNGVATQLRKESSIMVSNHCVAHRLALAVGAAAGRVEYVKRFNNTLETLYYFYENSVVRTAALKAVQESLEMPTSRPKRARTTRWLSHDQACDTLAKTLPAVIISLQREGAERGEPKAIGLSRLVEDWQFVACLYMMLDILPQLSILSKCFQSSSLDFNVIQQHMAMTIDILEARLINPGANFRKFLQGPVLEELREKVPDLELRVTTDGMESFKSNVHDKFVTALIENIRERFPDVSLLKSLMVFDPKNVPDMDQCDGYGEDELQEIARHYGLDEAVVEREWISYRANMSSTLKKELAGVGEGMRNLIKPGYADVHPNLVKIACAAMVIPVSTADCERGFSALKRIKTKLSNRLSNKVLNALIFVAVEGPDKLSDAQLSEVARLWKGLPN